MTNYLPFLILIFMFLAHIVDDYYLQGWLANGKQRSWWEKNAPDKLYRYDYKMALICHSMSWAIVTMLPIIIWSIYTQTDLSWLLVFIPVNMFVHAAVDDLKANRHVINLIIDQSIHFVQILITWLTWFLVFCR